MNGADDSVQRTKHRLQIFENISGLIYLVTAPVAAMIAHTRSGESGVLPFSLWLVIITLGYTLLTAKSNFSTNGPIPYIRRTKAICVYIACGMVAGLCLFAKPVWSTFLTAVAPPYCGNYGGHPLPLRVTGLAPRTESLQHTPKKVIPPASDPMVQSYLDANARFLTYIDELSDPKTTSTLVLASGAAGAGKSFLTDWIKVHRSGQIHVVDVAEKKDSAKNILFPPNAPLNLINDLEYRSATTGETIDFNKLPGPNTDAQTLRKILFPNNTVSVVLVDSLDELHPSYSKLILELLAESLRNKEIQAAVVLSRPEGFADSMRPGKEDKWRVGLTIPTIPIEMPNYCDADGNVDNQAVINRVANWRQRYDKKNTAHTSVETDVCGLLQKKPWLAEVFRNLAWSTELILRVARHPEWRSWEDQQWREVLFDAMCKRASDAHKRPEKGDPDYLPLLQEVAVKYWASATKNKDGYFDVKFSGDVVNVTRSGKPSGAVESCNVLERSGLIWIDPLDLGRFRFEPRWVQEHLVELRNLRSVPNYVYGKSDRYLMSVMVVDYGSIICWFIVITGVTTFVLLKAHKKRRTDFDFMHH